ncbi:MAG: hypothetical protein CVV49_17285 [Spirochaetae bacterium HGW-Spirochaetae-5]|nr:MAG: hypothetical protein CVV49_17285 [Spirochaetae bacterium HGW-Spirochaetae-5]
MKIRILILSIFLISASAVMAQTMKIDAKKNLKTARGTVAAFMAEINSGRYEESLEFFKSDPVSSGEITLEQYRQHCDSNLTMNKQIVSLSLKEKTDPKNKLLSTVTVKIIYKDKSKAEKYVVAEKVNGIWKLTTKGSMF